MLMRTFLLFAGVAVICMLSHSTFANPAPIAAVHEEPARRLTKAYEVCAQEMASSPTANANADKQVRIASTFVRCMATNMGLWSDAEGYNAKRVAKFFIKQRNEHEVMAVVDYCNQQHRQLDLDLWAFETYRCATAGRMGTWLGEYMLSAKIYNEL